MAADRDTVVEILGIARRYVADEQMDYLTADLARVSPRGNQSVADTLHIMMVEWRKMRGEEH